MKPVILRDLVGVREPLSRWKGESASFELLCLYYKEPMDTSFADSYSVIFRDISLEQVHIFGGEFGTNPDIFRSGKLQKSISEYINNKLMNNWKVIPLSQVGFEKYCGIKNKLQLLLEAYDDIGRQSGRIYSNDISSASFLDDGVYNRISDRYGNATKIEDYNKLQITDTNIIKSNADFTRKIILPKKQLD